MSIPQGTEMCPQDVITTGLERYPELAETFSGAADSIANAQDAHAAAGLHGSAMLSGWAEYSAEIISLLRDSASNLETTGIALASAGTQHLQTDLDNSGQLDAAGEGAR